MKNKKRNDKAILQQQKSNIIRDKKGRVYYINPSTEAAYKVHKKEEQFLYLYDSRLLFSLLPIALTEAMFSDKIIYAVIAASVIFYGFELYCRFFVIKNMTKANPPAEVFETWNSLEVLKAKRSDGFLKVMMGVMVAIIVLGNPNAFNLGGTLKFKDYLKNFATILSVTLAMDQIPLYFKVNKKIKGIKRSEKNIKENGKQKK